MQSKYRASIVSHTHWDREWYLPFEAFRVRLVGLIDELIQKMEADPRYRYFNFDGQAILFKDYLEIRPEMAPRLRALCQEGRITAGPFYVQPDESLPGAETHVRNFILGMKTAAHWGPVLQSGYVIDIFGHISQWPQMLRQLGIDNAILMRGVNDDTCGAEFIWRAPDGSDVLAIRLSNTVSYSDFWYKVRRADEGKLLDMDGALKRLKALIDWQRERHSTPELLLMDGVDHVEIQPDLPDLIDRYNAAYSEEGQVVHADLPTYLERLRQAVNRDELVTLEGELRSPNKRSPLGQVFFGFHCSHPELKAANDRCEALLQYWAEPLGAAQFLLTGEHDPAFLWHAWELLLQNQPHDSICGCSVDQVHKDMMYRYDQCGIVAQQIVGRQTKKIAQRQWAPCETEGAQAVHVFNGAGTPVEGVTPLTLALPHPRPEHFRLVDADGQQVPWQLVRERRGIPRAEAGWGQIPRFHAEDIVTIAVPLNVPAAGAAVYHAVPNDRPTWETETLLDGPSLCNGLIRLDVADDGTLTLTDLRGDTRRVYEGLNRFEDCGDVGDGWTYRPPVVDEKILSGPATVSVICDGPLYAALRVEHAMSVPCAAAPDKRSRSGQRLQMQIVSTVSILRGDPAVYIETMVDNPARDHKLRALFPTDVGADTWLSDSAFDFTERPIALPDTRDWDEPAQEIWWQQSVCTVADDAGGLAVIAPECKESACIDDSRRTLALSLFRAFGQTVGTAGEDGPQMLGESAFRYQLVPYEGSPYSAGLLQRAAAMRAGLRAVVLPPHEGDLPARIGLAELSPDALVLSAIKKREEAEEIILRFFNPTPEAIDARVRLGMPVHQAWLSNLKEDLLQELALTDERTVQVRAGAKAIITVAVK